MSAVVGIARRWVVHTEPALAHERERHAVGREIAQATHDVDPPLPPEGTALADQRTAIALSDVVGGRALRPVALVGAVRRAVGQVVQPAHDVAPLVLVGWHERNKTAAWHQDSLSLQAFAGTHRVLMWFLYGGGNKQGEMLCATAKRELSIPQLPVLPASVVASGTLVPIQINSTAQAFEPAHPA